MLPTLVPALECHGHLEIGPALSQKLLQVSPATIDRFLAPARTAQSEQHRRRRSRIVTGVRRRTTVRTFNGWKGVEPGWFEMDLVAHCGGRMEGQFLWTLVLTDVASGWSECVPLPGRDGLLERWCAEARKPVELTRWRAYKSNDQTWAEQKNGMLARRVVGGTPAAGAALPALCRPAPVDQHLPTVGETDPLCGERRS